jgi:hypothetical protein
MSSQQRVRPSPAVETPESTTAAPAREALETAVAVTTAPQPVAATPTLDAALETETPGLAVEEEGEGQTTGDPGGTGGQDAADAGGDGAAGGGAGGGGAGGAPEAPGDEGATSNSAAEAEQAGAGDGDGAAAVEGEAVETAADAAGGGGGGAAGGAGGGAPGGDAPGAGGVQARPAVSAQRVPQPGVATLAAPAARLSPEQSAAVAQSTGRDPASHQASAQAALSGLEAQIVGLQEALIQRAQGLAAEISGALAALSPAIQGGMATATAGVAGSFAAGRQSLAAAGASAHTAVDTQAETAVGGITASRSTYEAQIASTCAAAQAQVTAMATQWQAPFTALETQHGQRFAEAARAAADRVGGQRDTIAATFAGGGGSAIEAAKGEKKAKAARTLVDQGAARIRSQGPTRASTAVAQLGHAALVQSFLTPLASRVEGYQGEASQALTRALDAAIGGIRSDQASAHAQVDAGLATAQAALDADEQRATGDVDQAGEQLESDLTTALDSQEPMLQDAVAGQVDGYRAFAGQLGQELQGLPLLTDAQATEIVAEQGEALAALHAQNLAELEAAAVASQTQVEADVQTGLTQLTTLQTTTQQDVDRLVTEQVAGIGASASAFGAALGQAGTAVSDEMARWADPFGGTTGTYVSQVEAELAVKHGESDAQLAAALGTYQGELDAEVSGFSSHIDPNPAAEALLPQLRSIASEAYSAMRGLGTDESKLFNALRPVETATMGNAVREMWGRQYPSSGSLDSWIEDDCDSDEKAIAYGYLAGNTAAAARLELNDNMNWYGDDEAQIERILRGLSPDQRTAMQNQPGWSETAGRLQSNLGGTDLQVTDALLVGNDARADAYRLRDTIQEARLNTDNDALHTALAGMDPERRAQIAQEFYNIQQTGFQAGTRDAPPVDQAAAYDALVAYTTRDITVAEGTEYERTQSITGANRDLAAALIREGNDSVAADVARFEVERTRSGGPKQANMETALTANLSAEDRLAYQDPSNPRHAEVVAAQRSRTDAFEHQWQAQYGQANGAPANVQDGIRAAYASSDNPELEVEVASSLYQDGHATPATIATATQLAVDGMGTDEDRIQRMWSGLHPREADQARQAWESRYGNGETLDQRLFGGTFSEMSGDEAFDQRKRMLGDPQYFTGEYAARSLQLAEIEFESTGAADDGFMAETFQGDESANIRQHHADLQALINGVKSRNQGQAFGPDGAFLGTPQEYERYRELCAFVGITAQHYRDRQDSMANAVTTGLAVVGAVAAIVLTGGAATPLVAAAVAGGIGAAGVAANAAIKGGRYGWESAATDLGVAAVSAATAGAGAYLNGLNTVDDVARGIYNSGTAVGQAAGRATVGFGTGFVNGAASTGLQDQTWRNGWQSGLGNTLYSGAKGGAAGAAGSVASDAVKATPLGVRLTGPTSSVVQNGAGSALAGAASGAASKSTELTLDAATGRYKGEFSDAVIEVGIEALKSGGQGFLEGVAERHMANRAAQTQAPPEPATTTAPPAATPAEGTETARPTAGAPEGSVQARTAADPTVQRAVQDVHTAEADAAARLQSSDAQAAQDVTTLNRRIDAGTTTSEDGTAASTVPRAEAQAQLDGVEGRVLQTDAQVVARAQGAHDEAARVIPATEERMRAAGPDPAGPLADPTSPRFVAAEGPSPTRPTGATEAVDAATVGGRALGLTDAQIAAVRVLNPDQATHLRDRLAAGDSAEQAIAAAQRFTSPAAAPTAPATHPAAHESAQQDAVLENIIRLQRLGHLTEADGDYILGATDAAEMNRRLNERQSLGATATNPHYTDALREAQTTTDPTVRQARVQEVIDTFDQAGQGVAVQALRALDGNPDQQLELAHHLATYRNLAGRSPNSLTDAEIISLCHTHDALLRQFQIGETTMRKVVDNRTIESLLSMVDRKGNAINKPTVGGSIGDGRNSEGLTPAQLVQVLGLDYEDSPYLRGDGAGGFTPVDQVFLLETPVTDQMVQNVQVPLATPIRTRMEALAATDPVVAHVLARSRSLDPGAFGDTLDPFTGLGMTAPGPRLPGGQITLNQEYKSDQVSIPSGAQIFRMNADGQRVLLATFVQDHDGTRHWQVSSDCPPELRSRFESLADQGHQNAQQAR